MKISGLFLIIGIVVLGYSASLKPYTDENLFYSKYDDMEAGDSDIYYKLRDEMITPKYRIQDTGITLILLSLMMLSLLKIGRGNIRSPSSKSYFIGIAIILPVFTVAGYVFDIYQGYYRGEFPHWADSLAIPLAGVPVIFGILIAWSFLHLAFLKGVDVSPVDLSRAISKKLNIWIIAISFASLLLVLDSSIYGGYWYVVPGVCWIYFYISLGVNRIVAKGF